ncbi:MAG: hypothetical protein DRG30_06645 [Epsilonproteobacteria bacterium]|nr:MAG: hypothetical protein DRG30_06645 [Campylobacterota bacterium]
MTINKARLSSLIVIVPLLIIFVVGVYFIQNIWSGYMQTLNLQKHLNKTELYQSLEESVSKEIVCATIMSSNHKTLKQECQEDRDATDLIAKELEQQSSQILVIERINMLFSDSNKSSSSNEVDLFTDDHIVNTLQNIRYNIDVNENLRLSMFLNGEYHRKILYPIQSYWDKVGLYGANENKPYLTFFTDMSKLYTNATNEEILVAYFLVNEESFLSEDLAKWDNYIKQSVVPDISKYNYITPIANKLDKIFISKNTDDIISRLDSMRIDILLDYTDGRYSTTTQEWVNITQKKQKLFEDAKRDTLHFLSENIVNSVRYNESILLASIAASILSLLFIFIVLIRNYIISGGEDRALKKMMDEVNILTSKSRDEIVGSGGSLENLSDKKKIYAYFGSIIKLLQEKEMMAEEANVAKDLFLANMSHEIRTPLNGIVGFTQLLKDTKLTSDQKEFVDIIVNSSDNLLSIVNDILDLSKINANKMELEYISFDIYDKIESSVETFATKADDKRIDLGIYIDPKIPSKVFGDPTKLSQILINLISNAIKFTPIDGEIDMLMDIIEDEEKYISIKFAVKDSGIGISKEKKESIFQAFSQEDSSTSRKYGGTGLGLTISNNIVKFMGGELSVDNTESGGSIFFFTLRLEKDLQNIEEKNSDVGRDYSEFSVGLASPSLFMRNQLNRNLKAYIEHTGASFQYNTYDQLFNKTKEIDMPNVLFLDHKHTQRSGELEQLASLNIPIILMTTRKMNQLIDLSKYSYVKTIQKPITKRKIMRIMDICIHGDNALDNLDEDTTLPIGHFNRINALVAEDNLINQKLILITLDRFGLDVTLASNGLEAYEAREKGNFDIIFMDIQMPVMNGIEATKKIIEYEKRDGLTHVPIIALTANALEGDREKYMKIGMDGYAAKPLELIEIKNIIEKFLPDNVSNQKVKVDKPQEVETHEHTSEIKVVKESESIDASEAENKTMLLYCEYKLEERIYFAILKRFGYEVTVASNVKEFFDLIEKHIFTHAMYDYTHSDSDPCTVSQKVRDGGAIPIALIGQEEENDVCASTMTIKRGDTKETILAKIEEAK